MGHLLNLKSLRKVITSSKFSTSQLSMIKYELGVYPQKHGASLLSKGAVRSSLNRTLGVI